MSLSLYVYPSEFSSICRPEDWLTSVLSSLPEIEKHLELLFLYSISGESASLILRTQKEGAVNERIGIKLVQHLKIMGLGSHFGKRLAISLISWEMPLPLAFSDSSYTRLRCL